MDAASPKTPERDDRSFASPSEKYTAHISIVGHGLSEVNERFVKLKFGSETAIVRIDDLHGSEKRCFARLNQLGAHLISRAAQSELINRIQRSPPSGEMFPVATRLGWHKDIYVSPLVSLHEASMEVHLDGIDPLIIAKYRSHGSRERWRKIPQLAEGNTRLMTALALAFVGPLGALMVVEQPGLQLVGPAMCGKTGIGIAAGSVWGCHCDTNLASSRGFGETWNHTVNNLEPVALAHNHAFLILDETRVAQPRSIVEAVFRFERSSEKGRLTNSPGARSWWVPLLSTTNDSLDTIGTRAGVSIDDGYRSRLIDIPLPAGSDSMFENLHGYDSPAALTKRLIELSMENHGVAARWYLKQLLAWRLRDETELKNWLERRRSYFKKKAEQELRGSRDLSRFHEKFATIYAAGCLAIEFEVLSWKRKSLSKAILKCEKAHIDLVSATVSPQKIPTSTIKALRTILNERAAEFADLRTKASRRGAPLKPIGCIASKDGRVEYVFSEEQFEKIAGGSLEAKALKKDLQAADLIETTGIGKKLRFAVKRKLPGSSKRRYCIIVREAILRV